ncbi:alpha/beta hydrolase [Chloroflexi bacterium TSY]|nr:alpha/beta hydrolase [Chloroflexi bacterium TSY]
MIRKCDPEGTQKSGALYLICMPAFWNNTLLIYAHPYVAPQEPLKNVVTLPDGTSVPEVVNLLGYAFATTSYSTNGLAVQEAVEDLVDLVDIFIEEKGEPDRILLMGFSQGGHIAALTLERHPRVFDGGIAACGPYGNSVGQSDYFADFRVIFDYFFPDLIPGSLVDIPQSLIDEWDDHFATKIRPVLEDSENAEKLKQLFAVTGVASDPDDETSQRKVTENLLWYNIVGTNDAIEKLGGQPFGNDEKIYTGSHDDDALNDGVKRFEADRDAQEELEENYDTTGQIRVPLVVVHTRSDPIVPYWHAQQYHEKIEDAGRSEYLDFMPIDGFGHCTFNVLELNQAVNRLETMITALPPYQEYAYFPFFVQSN